VYSYIALTVPILPNLFVKVLKQLSKVITGVVYIGIWRFLEHQRVSTLEPTDFREISWILTTLLFLLVDD
jgi:hypothetical protein